MTETYTYRRGSSPLLVSMPHSGTGLGPFSSRMTDAAHKLPDTDWHLPRLYDFLAEMDATIVAATHSRYVIDLNRDPSGLSLYPGQNVTELCPTTTFAEELVYRTGEAPGANEIEERTLTYWRPYHDRLTTEIERIKAENGYVLLWDAHSIRSEVPRFFSGQLIDFNIGTNSGLSCSRAQQARLMAAAQEMEGYSSVLNGRFKGGYITRHYGQPDRGIHAVQLELSQRTYMSESHPFEYNEEKAGRVKTKIRALMDAFCG